MNSMRSKLKICSLLITAKVSFYFLPFGHNRYFSAFESGAKSYDKLRTEASAAKFFDITPQSKNSLAFLGSLQ
jgi:hypothetical protein